MSSERYLIGATVIAALSVPALALAQMQPAPVGAPQPSMSVPATQAPTFAPSAQAAGMDAGAVRMDATQFPPAQARALAQGDNAVVTNGPVPDTAANRAKYGAPVSNGGKATAPVGN